MSRLKFKFVKWVLQSFVCTCHDAIGIGTHAVCGKVCVEAYERYDDHKEKS